MIFKLRTIPNAIKAAARILWRKLMGRSIMVEPMMATFRHSICRICPSGLYNESTDQCAECTCFCSLKSLYVTERCPKNHWPPL